MSNWNAFEHRIWEQFLISGLDRHEKFLLTVSGGLDSMALLQVFAKLKPKSNVRVAHYHHGITSDQDQNAFRNQAAELVKAQCERLNFPLLFMANSTLELKSEEDCRNARWRFFRSNLQDQEVIVTGHHLDDRLETLLLKMIRGTSLDGLTGFKVWNSAIFRPFLAESRREISEYAEFNNIVWLDDPTNQTQHYLRNWIRKTWLPSLESKSPGSVDNLAKSLIKIAEQAVERDDFLSHFAANSTKNAISRQWYLSLSPEEQLRGLALFLRQQGHNVFTTGQLKEIRKRLDKNQNDIIFSILGRKWVINASQIMLE